MRGKYWGACWILIAMSVVGLAHADWPQWGGPDRDFTVEARELSREWGENGPPEVWTRVREHYDDGQIVEIVTTIGAYLQVSKFGDALGVQLEEVWHGHAPVLFHAEPPSSKAAQHHFEHFLAQAPAS